MPEGQVVLLHRSSGTGEIRPVRRHPNIRFTRGAIVEEDALSVRPGDWVSYTLSDSRPGQPHHAINVRRLALPRTDLIRQDPARCAEWDTIERMYEETRQAVVGQWACGTLTPHQRAGLLVDAEYLRSTRLTRGVWADADSDETDETDGEDDPRPRAGATSARWTGPGKETGRAGHDASMTADMQPSRCKGTVSHINARGFGFIQPHNSDGTVFFHASAVMGGRYDELDVEQQVDYIAETDANGRPRAVDVRPLDLDLDQGTGDELRPMSAADDDDDGNATARVKQAKLIG